MTPDLFWTLRAQHRSDRGALARRLFPEAVTDGPAMVGRVFANPTVPTSTGVFFSVNPVSVLGTEAESSVGSLVVNSGVTVPVYVVGSQAPVAGDDLICHFVNDRWVADRMAPPQTRPGFTNCPCTNLPDTLSMTSSAPGSNYGIFQSSELVYGPGPSWAGIPGLPAWGYWSPGTFVDSEPITGGSPFYYQFVCVQGYYAVRQMYPTTPISTPYVGIFRYSWVVGLTGNTCGPPVALLNGQVYPGGDPTCVVTITSAPPT